MNCACSCAVTSPAVAVSTSACEPASVCTSLVLRSTSRCLSSTFFCASSASVVSEFRLLLRLLKSVRAPSSLACACAMRQLERLRVKREQLVASVDMLALAHRDGFDFAGNIGRDQNLLRADECVVGRDIAAARSNRCRGRSRQPARASRPAGESACACGRALPTGRVSFLPWCRRRSWLPAQKRSSGLYHS